MAQYGFSTSTKIDDPLSPFIRPEDTQAEDYRKQTGELFGAIQDRLLKSQSDMATTKQAGLNTLRNTALTGAMRADQPVTSVLSSPFVQKVLSNIITPTVVGEERGRQEKQKMKKMLDIINLRQQLGLINKVGPEASLLERVGSPTSKLTQGLTREQITKGIPEPTTTTITSRVPGATPGSGAKEVTKRQVGGIPPNVRRQAIDALSGGTQPTTTGTQQTVQAQVDKMNQQINNLALDNNSQYEIDPSDPIQVTYKNGKYVLAGGTLINKRTGKSRKLVTSYQGKDIEINDSWVKQFKADMGVP